VHLFQSMPRVQAGWLTHPPKCSLTDAQMIRKRMTVFAISLLMHACITELVAKKSRLLGFS